ncbi:uncharacterized protein [Asterias amurensis]|uniref:uncharacterized protein n=1 Tax=Asterias amurensis TaxID=7602 RepID=UPI003AB71EDC
MYLMKPTSIVLVWCLFYSLQVSNGILQHNHVLPGHYYRPLQQHHRVRRAAAPAPRTPLRDCPCSSSPCLNGAECVSTKGAIVGTVEFSCTCSGQWVGTTCDSCPPGDPLCSRSCLVHRDNDVCNDGGPGSIDAVCAIGTDCGDCPSRCQ